MDLLEERGLPQEIEAERAMLGAVLLDNNILDQVAQYCQAESFFLEKHRRLFQVMSELAAVGQPIDLVTLMSSLRQSGDFERVGGAMYISSLIDGVPRTDDIKPYAKLVTEAALKRRLIATAANITSSAFGEDSIEETLIAAEAQIFALAESRRSNSGPEHVADIAGKLVDFYEQKGQDPMKLIGLSTGFRDIDKMTLGLTPGITLVAARPRCGKTSWVTNVACNVAEANGSVYFASIESSAEKIVQRVLSSLARIDSYRLRQGNIGSEEWIRLIAALRMLTVTKFVIDDTPDLTPEQLASRCRQHKAQYGLDLVVLDYIQLMARRLMLQRRYKDLRIAVQDVGAGLVDLSRRLDVPLLAVAQLSRDVDQRTDHRPQLSDLAESASLEQDADIVMFLHREELYFPGTENAGLAKVIFGKQRDGAEGEVDLAFIKAYTRFEDLAYEARPDTKQFKRSRGSSWGRGNQEMPEERND